MRSNLTREELLIVLIEECGEVIQAATKCLRFGFDHEQAGYGINHVQLAKELGDILGVADGLADQFFSMRDIDAMMKNRAGKLAKVEQMNSTVQERNRVALRG